MVAGGAGGPASGAAPGSGEASDPAARRPSSTVAAVPVEDHHIEALAEFMRAAWGAAATPEGIRRARKRAESENRVTPGKPPPAFLFLDGETVAGHVGTMPTFLWSGGREAPVHWIKGLMVLPRYQNGPVGFMLLKEAISRIDHAMALVVDRAACRLFEALGFKDLGVLPNTLRLIDPTRVLRHLDLNALGLARGGWMKSAVSIAQLGVVTSLAGTIGSAGIGLWTALRGRYGNARIETGHEPDPDQCTELWERMRSELAASPTRDGRYVHARYRGERDDYRWAAVLEGDTLAGLAVVRCPSKRGDPRLKGIRVATLSELLYRPSDTRTGLAVLAAAEETAREVGADALLATTSHRLLAPLLRRRAFLTIPGNLHFLLRVPPGGEAPPADLASWWLTRGDSRADDTF